MSEIARDLDSELLSVSRAYVGLPPEKRKLFRSRIAERGVARASLPIVPFPGQSGRFPLSHAQERLWFLWRLEPLSASYNITGAVQLDGTLDTDAVRAAVQAVCARHESLRKRFEEHDGVAWQIVGETRYDWQQCELDPDAEANLKPLLRERSLRPFDLTRDALLRVTLVRLGPGSHVLHFAMHHIVSDAWSLELLTQEFAQAYEACCRGAEHALEPLPIQYGDYALWQREWLDEAAIEAQLGYWRARLGTEHPVLELPLARKRTGLRSAEGGRVDTRLTPALSAALRRLSQRHGATLFMTLLAAYDLLLARYSGQKDIRVGVPAAGRDRLETEGLIGFFVNTLVIRTELAGVHDFGALLAQVRDRVVEAQAHQDLPFARLVDALQPARSLSHTPLFQAMFNYAGAGRGAVTLPGLTIHGVTGEAQTARFDLVLNVADGESIAVSLGYARDVLDEAVVSRMLGHYVQILGQIAGEDATQETLPLGAIALGVEGDWHMQPPARPFEPVMRRIAQQAQMRADAQAVHCEGERLMYGELEGWANRIARRLALPDTGTALRDERIGLCLTRSAGVIAALLGVLKSGAAFVPLDPEYPAGRLAMMMEDAGVRRVIADGATASRLAGLLAGCEVIDIEDVAQESDAPFEAQIHPEQLAYVIYTSGSTGRPKGVAISHRALGLHLEDFIATYGITSSDRQLQSSTINFDVALHEMLPALMQGGQVEMRGPQLWDLETTSRHLAEGKVTFSRIPTAYWQQWLREPPSRERLASLRQITVGGEGLPGDALRQWREGPLASIRLDNLYGPTETTVACLYRHTQASDVEQAIVSIGVPYASRVAYVMDDAGNEVPVGALGELCIGGATLARGYLGRPGQTAEKFIPDPFRDDGARLYRTGDLCRRREDGTIDFLGRIDQQVKLRGFRIELGEIEAALRQVEGVRQAAAELRGVGEGRRLVGYVSGDGTHEISVAALRRGLEGRLPGYMVPSAFVVLDRLPVMPNGKIDRAALPEPEDIGDSDHFVAPAGELESMLAGIWADVLGIERIGRHDNFFERGGDSIRCLKAVAAIQRGGIDITPRLMFEHQDVAALAQAIGEHGATAAPPLVALAAEARNALPLSFAQQRLWFLWNLQPESSAYHVTGAMRLKGTLDASALRASFDALVQRHESLRTTFAAGADGHATQNLHAIAHYDYRTFDAARSGNAAQVTEATEAWAAALAAQPFDLTTGPLLRVGVARVAADEHVLVVVMHHIVSDGWSIGVLLREFVEGYRARVSGESVAQSDLPIQYADYAVWQRRWLADGEQERQLSYWRATLGGEQPVLALPTDRPRQALGAWRAASETVSLPQALGEALQRVARERNATLFTVLLAAFDALLHRYTGETDIRIGVPVANRNRVETEGLIGFFVNTQVLKAELDGRTTLAALLDHVKARAFDAQAHQDLPFDVLVDALQPERSLSHTPLFQVAFNHQRNDYQAADTLEGLTVERYRVGDGAAQFELTVNTQELPDGTLDVSLRYARELFDAETMARFGRHYVRMLEALTGDLERSIDAIELLDAHERRDLLAWGRNDAAWPNALPVHERIRLQAEATPDAVAVVCGEASLNYGELEARANALAHRLIALGVKPEVRVGIALERSLDMIVGLLAILKAGGAYVPLDPDYPQDRLAYMIGDSGIALLLTHAQVRDTLPVPASLSVLELDTLDLSAGPHDAPAVRVEGANLAYVIYTSGSTGRPKGAQLTHHNVARLLDATSAWFDFGTADVWTMFHSFAFDFSVWEIFGALCHGGRLVVVPFAVSRAPEEFAALLRRERVTVLNQTPSAFRQLLQVPGLFDGEPLALREVIFGGEALEPRVLRPWIERFGVAQPRLVNMYGITETTVHVTFRPVVVADLGGSVSPVGARIADLGVYVLDAQRNLVPVGVTGELYVGGAGVARGYLNRASLTAERFVPDPFGREGERLYRTGDLARWNANGELEYLGRIDHQVKICGFRIELGEIDAQLLAQAPVREAATLAQEGPGGARLVSYVTPRAGTTPDVAALRAALRAALAQTLPDYMVPVAIVVLESLPLTSNGKLDRKALPQPEFESAAEYEAPEGATEAAIAEIWREVLGIARVGRHDNFFELGGDSILSLQIVARAREAGWKITPRHIFEHQTLAALAASLASEDEDAASNAPIAPVPADQRDALPLSFAQQRLWFLWNLQPESRAYHIDGALKLGGALDIDALRGSFDALVQRHESLRTTFAAGAAGQAVQRIVDRAQARCDCTVVDLAGSEDRDTALSAWAASLCEQPFDLTTGPLLRVGVARVAADEHVLVVVMHHIVSDGWSMGVLLREFVEGYRARVSGESVARNDLPIQYADYAVWQRRWLADGEQERQLAYWRATLGGGEQPVLVLPTDRPRHALGAWRSATEFLALPAPLVDALRRVARERNATPFMVLLAAFDALLHRHTGETDIRIGVPVANRNRVETEGLIGFFVNTQVLKAELDGRMTLAALLDQVKARALDAQAHQDLPFDVLVDALQPERSLSHTPLFQVAFNHQRSDYRVLEQLPGLSIGGHDLGEGAAQFELTLNAQEFPDGTLNVSLRYARELFDAETMARFGRHYVRMLEALTGDLERSIDAVELLDAHEREDLLAWGRNDAAWPNALPVHERIRLQTEATPDAVAVVCGEASLSYGELEARANVLAHRLIALGVKPEVRVGIALERSLDMIVGLLAILKAGGAYVPLDPDYPQDRLAYMIGDSGIALLLTHAQVRDTLPVPASLEVLELDTLDLSAGPYDAPAVRVEGANLAYVIYTSGSTGRPKGAQLTHHNVARLLDATSAWFDFGPADVWTMFHSFAFDFSVWEIFGALCHGGRLVVVPFAVSRAPEEFAALLRRERVTVLNQTPSAFRQLLQVPGLFDGEPLALREVIFGGEALEPRVLRPWIERFGVAQPRLVNMYGITETTVHVTFRPVVVADLDGSVSPVGERIADLGVYVLDAQRNLVPVGVTGELYVGGAGVARGYLNRASLTAERFVPDPFGGEGERLYCTGDLARWNASGELEYLGRIDHQVKIRGFRIELGEIDAQLLAQATVREAATLAQEGPGGARLVSYVTARAGITLDVAALRAALAQTLPDYMVPVAIVVLDSLPLTSNGKLDRKALPQPEFESAAEYEAPEGATEAAIAEIWREVLGIANVGRHDNFFELGGDSILSLQIVARLREAGWKITPRQLFERQTVALLAAVAQRAQASAIAAESEEGVVPLLPIQSWFFATPMAHRAHWNQAVLLEGPQAPDPDALRVALQAVVAHHGALRLRFEQDAQGTWQQAYATDNAIRHDLLWEREATDASQIGALCDEAQRSLNLSEGPLLRALLIRLPQGAWRLLLAIHHLAVDGVSWRILLDDLQQAYEQARTHGPVTLPPNGTTYQAWAKRLAAHAQGEDVRGELAYWRTVADAPSRIPADDPQGASTVAQLRHVSQQLAADATHRLLHEVPAAYRTQINDVLLTALGRALCAWTGDESIRIDLEGHGREDLFEDIDLSRTVGWFTSLYPVKLEACGEPGAALKRVKEALRAVPQRGLGFGLLKYAGTVEDRTTLADATPSAVVFNYLGQFDGSFTATTGWRPAAGSAGQALDPQATLTHALTINARIYDGALTISISYSGARHREATVQALLNACMAELEALIAHCTSGATGATPSDFPLASLTQAELDALPIPASAIEDLYPLSPMQAGMLFHTLYAPGGSAYLNQLRIDIDDLDIVKFRAAWEAATAQHTILRTGFVQQGEGWLQWIAREAPLPFMLHDWSDRSDHTDALDTLAAHDLAQGFDLARPPLQRVTLVRTAAQRHHLIWTHHHVLMDGWSVSQLMGDVLRHYDGRTPVAAGGRYRDYIDWLARRDAGASETYWRGVLAELDEPTRLATALGNADPQPGHGEHLLALDEAATTRLVAFARACRVTVNTLVQAAWSLVLQRSTGQRSVVFGATVAGRPDDLPGASRLLGLFINTVPVVSAPGEGARLGEWLQALQAQSVASQEHAHTPLYEIQRWSGAGAQGLFDTLLVFENYPVDEALKESAPGGLTFGALTFREETNYALTLGVTLGERLLVSASHARAQFDGQTVERLLAQLERALAQFTRLGASACLGEVSLLDAQEHETLLALGRNDFSPAQTMPVHAQIQARAQATPQATALVLDDVPLSYGDLEARANRLAHRLIALGVKPEVRVGIAVERSLDMVVGLLAILKAGGAYVPLDPEYPRERLAYMMEDSGIALLLTQTALRDPLPVPAQLQVVDLDTLDVSTEPATAPAATIHDDTLAYVIYTSGSTGRPKGVAVAHGALAMHCQAIGKRYALTPQDRLLQFASISFDAAQEQWLIPLLAGAALVLRGRELWSTSRLADALKTQGVSVLYLPPAYVDEFARSVGDGEVAVGTCIVGGEAWSRAGFEAVRERLRAQRIFNAYGPAETVITPTVWEAGDASHVAGAYAPVGRPVGARRAYVLDASLNLVPQGATGELYLGGAGLARGYLNRPGLTADRFVPDPFDANGGRLYRTGDLVRWNAQGELEYVSRIDHQVKIRGFRVEPGEIEALLRAQPAVREAVVTAQAAAGGARLVAYATPQAGASLDALALRDALAATLPDYMVPARVVVLDALPLSPNGKVDRAALPALELQSAAHEPPQGDDEAALAAIWGEVLGVERVGRHDTFFELGGHSLLALQAQRRIQRQLSVEIPLPVFFSHATLREIAASSLSSRHAAAQAKARAVTDMQALLDDLVN